MHTDAPVTLAILALHELSIFQSTAADAQFAPSMRDTIELSRIGGYALNNFETLVARIEQRGGDVVTLLEQFAQSFHAFNQRTQPTDWHESLMKSYVHDGLVRDYVHALEPEFDPQTHDVITAVLDDTRRETVLRERLGGLVAADDTLGWRLALWGRKLVVETAARLAELRQLTRGEHATQLDATAWQAALLGHSRRMSAIGLVA